MLSTGRMDTNSLFGVKEKKTTVDLRGGKLSEGWRWLITVGIALILAALLLLVLR